MTKRELKITEESPVSKRPPYPKRKVAIMMGYCGSNYQGMQLNPNAKTIELALFEALYKDGLISNDNAVDPKKIAWMRACRTDKGVHAAGQVVSTKMLIRPDTKHEKEIAMVTEFDEADALVATVPRLNALLPNDIRVFGIKRASNSFHAKERCDSRFYEYLLPTYSLAPASVDPYLKPIPKPFDDGPLIKTHASMKRGNVKEHGASDEEPEDLDEGKMVTEWVSNLSSEELTLIKEYRIDDDRVTALRGLMKQYQGSKMFHNFTLGKASTDPSARRKIIEVMVREPFIQDGMEWISILFHGQSFMIHQIRKMVGLAVLSIRLNCDSAALLDHCLRPNKVNIPKAPALGLLLDKGVFSSYNKKFDNIRETIDFDEYEVQRKALKDELIYPKIFEEEKKYHRFMGWLKCNDEHASEFGLSKTDKLKGPLCLERRRQRWMLTVSTDYAMESKQDTSKGSPSESTRSAKLSIKSLIDHDSNPSSPSRSSPRKRVTIHNVGEQNPNGVGSDSSTFVSSNLTVRLTLEEPPVVSLPTVKNLQKRRSSSTMQVTDSKRRQSKRLSRDADGSILERVERSPKTFQSKSTGQEEEVSTMPTNKIRIRLRPSPEATPSEVESTTQNTLKKEEAKVAERLKASPRKEPSQRRSKGRVDNTTSSPGHTRSKHSLHKNKRKTVQPVKEESVLKKETFIHDRLEEEPTTSPSSILNNEFCSTCSGAGTLICCESCPKSFHFVCVDPPIDPENVPDENWFCNECQSKKYPDARQRLKPIKNVREIWNRLTDFIDRMNPKLFTVPKRIRKIIIEGGKTSVRRITGPGIFDPTAADKNPEGVEEEAVPAPVIRSDRPGGKDRLTNKGICHYCGKGFGLDSSKLLICCDECSLQWHLDCLPYPLAVYPSSHRRWLCPVHLTKENLSHLPPKTVSRILETNQMIIRISDWPDTQTTRLSHLILPDTAIRLQFGWSINSLRKTDSSHGCSIPSVIREAYELMRNASVREAKLLHYYDHYRYTDRSVETTNLVI